MRICDVFGCSEPAITRRPHSSRWDKMVCNDHWAMRWRKGDKLPRFKKRPRYSWTKDTWGKKLELQTAADVVVLQGLPMLTSFKLRTRDLGWGWSVSGTWTTPSKETGKFKAQYHKQGNLVSFKVIKRGKKR